MKGPSRRFNPGLIPAHSTLVFFFCLMVSFLCPSCVIVPMKLPTRTISTSGEDRKVDLSFIQAGTTRKEEVVQKLGWLDTGLQDRKLFWGRWVSSSWGVSAIPREPVRIWGNHNVLIEFDEQGLVQRSQVVPDKDLNGQLQQWLERMKEQPLDLSTPIELDVAPCSGFYYDDGIARIILSADFAEFTRGVIPYIKVSRVKIVRISASHRTAKGKENPFCISQSIQFSEEIEGHREISMAVNASTLLTLLRYFGLAPPNSSRRTAPARISPKDAAIAQMPDRCCTSTLPSPVANAPLLQADVTVIRIRERNHRWTSVQEGEGGLWVCELKFSWVTPSGKCFRVDSTVSPAELIPLPLNTLSLAPGFGSVWMNVSKGADAGVHRLDAKTYQETAKIPIRGMVFIADGSVWIIDRNARLLYRVDPKTNQTTAKIPLESKSASFSSLRGTVPAMGSVWVLSKEGIVRRIDPESNKVLAEIRVGPPRERFPYVDLDSYTGLAVGEGSAWITESKVKEEGNLIRVDVETNQVVATIPVGYRPSSVGVGGGFVWVFIHLIHRSSEGDFMLKIDPRTNQILGKVLLRHCGQPRMDARADGILTWNGDLFCLISYK